MQAEVIPAILESAQQGLLIGRGGYKPSDICVSAPTGSGKTLAFVIPVIQVSFIPSPLSNTLHSMYRQRGRHSTKKEEKTKTNMNFFYNNGHAASIFHFGGGDKHTTAILLLGHALGENGMEKNIGNFVFLCQVIYIANFSQH